MPNDPLVVFQWLKNLSLRYPQNIIVCETIDPCGALAQRWGIKIPAFVTNEDILQTGLLTAANIIKPFQSERIQNGLLPVCG